MYVQLKRIYEDVADNDGKRVLVDGIWPRGISKQKAQLDEWLKEVAPSTNLRKWFSHDPDKFQAFKKQYQEELEQNDEKRDAFRLLKEWVDQEKVTLLFASKEESYNHARVLQELLRGEEEER